MAESTISLVCPVCKKQYEKHMAYYNQSIKRDAPQYCGKICAGLGRRLNKTHEQLKAEKAKYDDEYRKNNQKRIKQKKKEAFKKSYAENPDKYREQRKKRMPYHIEYCRQPKVRAKEKEARYRREGKNGTKKCLGCGKDKHVIEFQGYLIFPDKRHYICKECEAIQDKELDITTREVLQCIRSGLNKHQSNLTIRDFTPHPYLIEAHKYLLLLKRSIR
ncbi:hypothetical protein [uncultured Clostridium sp.]|uniref:hypothetical protein n=1 Tax=uncultured Clostridium sp. TaxID=59620 RepID=UPI00260198F3|nr:hypothetical protein [uncultured Clostridium sp.]